MIGLNKIYMNVAEAKAAFEYYLNCKVIKDDVEVTSISYVSTGSDAGYHVSLRSRADHDGGDS